MYLWAKIFIPSPNINIIQFVIVDFSLEICKYVFMNKRISDNPNLSEVHVLHDANNISSAKILRILQIKCGIYGEMWTQVIGSLSHIPRTNLGGPALKKRINPSPIFRFFVLHTTWLNWNHRMSITKNTTPYLRNCFISNNFANTSSHCNI